MALQNGGMTTPDAARGTPANVKPPWQQVLLISHGSSAPWLLQELAHLEALLQQASGAEAAARSAAAQARAEMQGAAAARTSAAALDQALDAREVPDGS